MKNTMLKIIMTLLVFAIVTSAFAGCRLGNAGDGEGNDSETVGENSGDSDVESDPEDTGRYDKNGKLMDDLPEDLNYAGNTEVSNKIKILAWKDAECTEFDVKEISGNKINNAIFSRDQQIQTRLGVSFEYVLESGNVDNVNKFKEKVSAAFTSGSSDTYDIVASYTRSTAVCATAGYLLDLGHIPDSYIDTEKPWWNRMLIDETSTIDGKYYFLTGDASTSLAQKIYCVYFNADAVEKMGQESPYTLVKNNEWTLEKMGQMSKTYYMSSNSSEFSVDNQYGTVGTYYDWPALLHGCGIDIIEKNVAGDFVLDTSIKDNKAITIMEDLDRWIQNEGSFIRAPKTGDDIVKNFVTGNSMFIVTDSGSGIDDMQDVNSFEYGCVPCPKYDSEQTEYYSTVRQPITLFGIMGNIRSTARVTMITAVLECWGSEGYRKTTPAIFESAMQEQSTTSANMKEMLQLIKDSAWFDCARIYAVETNYICDQPGYYLVNGDPWDNYVSTVIPDIEDTWIPALSDMLNR